MKKLVALLLMAVMSLTLLTACTDPVYDDFENFLNVEMTDVNANYTKITTEAAKWGDFDDPQMLVDSINNVMLPTINESLSKLANITPATEEVTNLKAKYVKVMDKYKEGFETMLAAIDEDSEEKLTASNDMISEGVQLLNEYNEALEAMAEEYGAEIEY